MPKKFSISFSAPIKEFQIRFTKPIRFTIDRIKALPKSRRLKAEYTMEIAQDLKAIHGMDAEKTLANILSKEILEEVNREVIRSIYNKDE